jgi:hypothetical protein
MDLVAIILNVTAAHQTQLVYQGICVCHVFRYFFQWIVFQQYQQMCMRTASMLKLYPLKVIYYTMLSNGLIFLC